MVGFMVGMDNGRGINRNSRVGGWLCQDEEGGTPGGRVGGHQLNDADKVLLPVFVIQDVEIQ